MALIPKKDELNTDFLFQWYLRVGEKFGNTITQGTKQQSYNAELLSQLPITLPTIQEQMAIVTVLESVDSLITLHQRKYVLLIR